MRPPSSVPPVRARLAAALALSMLLVTRPAAAQDTTRATPGIPAVSAAMPGHSRAVPLAHATERRGAVTLDGRLDEAAWAAAQPVTDFTQTDPSEGRPGTERTEVRFLFDGDAIYVGARMWDSSGAAGVRTRLVRRDADMESDWFQVIFDSYHDHLSRSFFQVNPSGVKMDMSSTGTSNLDASWDPIWEVATRVDAEGWTAELRIPLSQLRFAGGESQTWGLQVRRFIQRKNEQQQWAFWRRSEAGGPAFFGHLDGLRLSNFTRRVELLPYAVSRAAFVRPAPGDPFNQSQERDYRVGGDVKALLTSNLTLDATFNPDFGQVEVDPANVNLSAFETFFEEKRPFFVEGSGIFGFGDFSCMFCSNVSSVESFYSRRIGRRPQLDDYVLGTNAYANVPDNSTILGAAKVTGRTGNGYSIGLLDAVTRRETADALSFDGSPVRQVVEPLTNYSVGRVKRDLDGGNLIVGAIGTSVARSLGGDPVLGAVLDRHAELGGADFTYRWGEQKYDLIGSYVASNVTGDPLAISRIQRASARYFQRPDRGAGRGGLFDDRLDPAATSLRGYGGYTRVAKDVGDWLWETSVNFRSPGFEANDISFLRRSDYVWHNGNVARQWNTPHAWYRNLVAIAGAQEQFNYDGDRTDLDYHAFVGSTLANFWESSAFIIHHPVTYDDKLLRGGPVAVRTGFDFGRFNLSTDSRKPVVLGLNLGASSMIGDRGHSFSANTSVRVKPASNVSISLAPSMFRDRTAQQYVARVDSSPAPGFYGSRYVFGTIEQTTASLETRLNWTFTPALSLELYAQPFVASGDYFDFKEFETPRSLRMHEYAPGTEITEQRTPENQLAGYAVRPANGTPFSFGNPDFTVRALRGNAVLRWEYRPGSTIFFVWQQSRDDADAFGDFSFERDRSALFRAHPDNIFLVKVNYWYGR